MRPRPLAACWLIITAVALPRAAACPFCATETGQQVRARIFGADFFSNAIAVAAPFPLLLLVVLAFHTLATRRSKP
ncbi:MAG TPA: hypothetical protein VEQ85_10130 [Lacipirellulaceae bacterium]|nr:hypothetical protein [Lacipirellulaceae bacterium]